MLDNVSKQQMLPQYSEELTADNLKTATPQAMLSGGGSIGSGDDPNEGRLLVWILFPH
jgi:hypothetical protein